MAVSPSSQTTLSSSRWLWWEIGISSAKSNAFPNGSPYSGKPSKSPQLAGKTTNYQMRFLVRTRYGRVCILSNESQFSSPRNGFYLKTWSVWGGLYLQKVRNTKKKKILKDPLDKIQTDFSPNTAIRCDGQPWIAATSTATHLLENSFCK